MLLKRFCLISVGLFTLLYSMFICAQWQQGQATVVFNGAELDDVRVQAMKNAIADASFQNGSFVAAEDIVLDGLLVSSKSVITTQGRIQRVEVLSETVTDEALTVVVRVDLTPILECEQDEYLRSLLTTQFQLLKPQQASNGGIFDLGKQISKRFRDQLASGRLQVSLIDKAFADPRATQQMEPRELADKSFYMSRQFGKQFVLYGFIRDISLFEQVKTKLIKDDVSLRRNFTIQIYLLDVFRNSMVFQDSYHSEADWAFSDDYSVDTNNSLFWRSDYGRVVLNTIHSAVSDVTNALECEKSYAQIINNTEHQFTINIGKRHGVKVGDKFKLYKKRLSVGVNGLSSPIIQGYPSDSYSDELRAIQVDDATTLLESGSANQFMSGDVLDLVSPIF
ncbi:MAG: flagellar assembly protein FlgT [Paraglaciecola sp.]|uniref:flagellar assembly protein T N-terminal domain-containing protein n=1 Tax=Paraglaciecola sp. TaxID=1920173 RepID=UPI00274019F0|nr:flagellar assembly protein T N-terminal domain-containing protein [Paraglaciecola sp.]MDP5030911.1 flagellar assembly protein FlgT [Paraglaciecola sp.]MDP5132267.1 flagellar assembly protein FlgT [Paraglaciecola sp.]